MPYRVRLVDQSIAIVWTGTPSLADVESLARDFTAARQRASKTRLSLWIVIPVDDVDLPSREVRARFERSMADVFAQCAAIFVILNGSGVRASLMRTALRTMAVLARISTPLQVFDNVWSAATEHSISPALLAELQ